MTFISHLHFPVTAFPPSFMHIFLLLKPGRNDVRAGLAEPLMESNCLLPEAARLHLDEPQVPQPQLFTGAPSPTGQASA